MESLSAFKLESLTAFIAVTGYSTKNIQVRSVNLRNNYNESISLIICMDKTYFKTG